jgi:hypothetical protein
MRPTTKGIVLTDIETRSLSGSLTSDDIQLLIATCRHFLSRANGGSSQAPTTSPISEATPAGLIHVNGDTFEIFTDGACEGNPGPIVGAR